MSEVFIPLGGAGGKNRGTAAVLGDSTPFSNSGAVMSLPLPAGNYKKSVSNPRANYGDGKNSEVTISKELLKKMAIEAFGIASITNFSATMYAHKQVRLTWARPTKGLWSGTFFVFKKGRMPNSVYDSDIQYASGDTHLVTQPLSEGLWYIRAFNYVATNNGRWYDDGKVSYMINVTGISGSVTFGAGAGTWTVPANVYKIRYILVGHGGAGYSMYYKGGGGGGGGYFTTGYMDVSPGQTLSWIVPTAQGQPTVLNGVVANSGESPPMTLTPTRTTKPYQYIDSPTYRLYTAGGSGGSGGGGGHISNYGYYFGGSGGSNGSMGGGSAHEKDFFPDLPFFSGGQGQGTSTLGFNGVLYSGGGGGASTHFPEIGFEKKLRCYPREIEPNYRDGYYYYDNFSKGGAGGGGNGFPMMRKTYSNGIDGLGGGGGGSIRTNDYNYNPQIAGQGGTGCIYIAWGSSMNDGS